MSSPGGTMRMEICQDVELLEGIKGLLVLIRQHGEEVDKLLKKYNPKGIQSSLEQIDSNGAPLGSLEEAADRMAASSLRRQQKVSHLRKVIWVVSDQRLVESLAEKIEKCIQALEKLSEGGIQAVTLSGSSSNTLQDVVRPSIGDACTAGDESTVAGISVQLSAAGHTYHENCIGGQARVTQGDIGPDVPAEARKHAYVGNKITGNARVIQGNTSTMDMRSFWDD